MHNRKSSIFEFNKAQAYRLQICHFRSQRLSQVIYLMFCRVTLFTLT